MIVDVRRDFDPIDIRFINKSIFLIIAIAVVIKVILNGFRLFYWFEYQKIGDLSRQL